MCAANTTHPTPEQLADFVAGKLNPTEQTLVESHVADCADCCDLLRSLPDETLLHRIRLADTSFAPGETSAGLAAESDGVGESMSRLPLELVNHPRYRIVRQLGAGGMGVVYEAEHRLMNRPVALKVIRRQLVNNKEAIDRFHLEVRAAARLSHRNIVTAHDAEQAGDAHFLVMEYVAGASLTQLVQQHGPLSVLHGCNFVMQAAQGLQHAAEQGMVHRDIKPQNLMRTPKGTIKILDFGLARLASDIDSGRLTRAGSALGTIDYIAPEQVQDSRHVDIRADIYSLGCTLYYLLAGHVPYPAGSLADKIRAHMNETPRPLSEIRTDVPPDVVRVVERMMAKDPANRFQMPVDVVDALKPFARPTPSNGQSTGTEPVPPTPPPRPVGQRESSNAEVAIQEQADPFDLPFADLPSMPYPTIASPTPKPRAAHMTKQWFRFGLPFGIAALLLGGWWLWPIVRGTLARFGRGVVSDLGGKEPRPQIGNEDAFPLQPLPNTSTSPDGWIDLTPSLDLSSNAVAGQWRRSGTEIMVDATTGARLMLPYAVPEEYDFEVRFTRTSGQHSVALFFIAGDGQATYEIDAWYQHLAGIQRIRRETMEGNAPSVYRELQNGRSYTARIEVRRRRVATYLDDELVVTYEGDGNDLSVVDGWQMPSPNVLGIGAYESATTFHRIRLRLLGNAAK